MGGACGLHGRERRAAFGCGKLKKRDNLEDLGVDGSY